MKTVDLEEVVHFDGVVVRDGVRGGSGGSLHRRWDMDCVDYDPSVKLAMTHLRWLQIKHLLKPCDNDTAPKKGQAGYDTQLIMDYLGKKGFGATMTCRRDRLPFAIDGQ
jgi:hypothetical protein